MIRRPLVAVAVVAALQLLIVGLAVAPQLSAHARGEEYRLRVAPVDPIDPFRGAYVALSYPGLRARGHDGSDDRERVFVPLVPRGDVWRPGAIQSERPADPPYLACTSDGWELDCGIDSYFADQDEALRLERDLGDGGVATLKIDSRGNAAVVAVSAG